MILTVTLNPLLERRYYINNLHIGGNLRSDFSSLSAGGKGINVSRQLNHLGVANLAFIFLGGTNGKILKNLLAEEKINFTFVQTKNESRDAALIIEESGPRVTTVFGTSQVILESELEEFKNKLRKIIENCEIVVFSGSSPSKAADEIFPFGINYANENDKISILDTYGRHLQDCIDQAPTIIHNNISELSSSLRIDLSSEENIVQLLHKLYDSGVKQTYLTNGKNPVYAGNFDFIYKVEIPQIMEADATGSGDAFTAGLAYGLHHSLTFEESLQNAVSLGMLNASRTSVCNVSQEELGQLTSKVSVKTIGKKIRTAY